MAASFLGKYNLHLVEWFSERCSLEIESYFLYLKPISGRTILQEYNFIFIEGERIHLVEFSPFLDTFISSCLLICILSTFYNKRNEFAPQEPIPFFQSRHFMTQETETYFTEFPFFQVYLFPFIGVKYIKNIFNTVPGWKIMSYKFFIYIYINYLLFIEIENSYLYFRQQCVNFQRQSVKQRHTCAHRKNINNVVFDIYAVSNVALTLR